MSLRPVISCLLAVAFLGCSQSMHPTTTGSQVSTGIPAKGRFVVWSNHAGDGHYIEGLLLRAGQTVVERHQLEQVFREQKIRLIHEDEASVIRVGRMVGATQVIFVEVSGVTYPVQVVSVSVRSVSVESGEVLWVGTAKYPEPPANPEQAALNASHWAIARATCLVSQGARWEEPSASRTGGCTDPDHHQVSTAPRRDIWEEMRRMQYAQ